MKMLFYFSLETIGAEIYVQNNIIYLKLNICVQVQDFLTSHPSEDRTKKLYTSLTNFLLKRLKNEQQPVDATLSKPAGHPQGTFKASVNVCFPSEIENNKFKWMLPRS